MPYHCRWGLADTLYMPPIPMPSHHNPKSFGDINPLFNMRPIGTLPSLVISALFIAIISPFSAFSSLTYLKCIAAGTDRSHSLPDLSLTLLSAAAGAPWQIREQLRLTQHFISIISPHYT